MNYKTLNEKYQAMTEKDKEIVENVMNEDMSSICILDNEIVPVDEIFDRDDLEAIVSVLLENGYEMVGEEEWIKRAPMDTLVGEGSIEAMREKGLNI